MVLKCKTRLFFRKLIRGTRVLHSPLIFAQPASPANCSRKYIPYASLFVGPLTGGSSYSEGVGSAISEILIFALPLCNTLCMCWDGWCSPILGVPTRWVNANYLSIA